MSDFKLYSNDMLNRVNIVKNRPGITIWSKNQTNKKSKPNKQEKNQKTKTNNSSPGHEKFSRWEKFWIHFGIKHIFDFSFILGKIPKITRNLYWPIPIDFMKYYQNI